MSRDSAKSGYSISLTARESWISSAGRKLAFACLLTAVGIPMILAGEEFADQHDRFDSHGNVSQDGGKQVDPVDFSRLAG